MNMLGQSIKLHNIPLGKQSFIARVDKISKKEEKNYHGHKKIVSYIHLKEILISVNETLYKVDSLCNQIAFIMGKKLERLDLKRNDLFAFDAQVESGFIEFLSVEGKNNIETSSFAVLPKEYDGIIKVELYETEFTKNIRISKNNYERYYDREKFDKKFDKINYYREATDKQFGYFREVKGMYFENRVIKNLSNIKKLRKISRNLSRNL